MPRPRANYILYPVYKSAIASDTSYKALQKIFLFVSWAVHIPFYQLHVCGAFLGKYT